MLGASAARAGGGWVAAPGTGYLQSGTSWKDQPGAQRRDREGQRYVALNHLNHTLTFAYLSGQVGVYKRLEAGFSLSYLWASERFDDDAEEPDITFQGASDLWLGLKYQVHTGPWLAAVEVAARLPYLYDNHQKDPSGQLGRDLALKTHLSHSFGRFYGSGMAGFKWREGAPANQLVYGLELGGQPWSGPLTHRLGLKLALDGMASVGDDSRSTFPRDRFSGLTLDRGNHLFNFNRASLLSLQGSLAFELARTWSLQSGYGHTLWGKSIEIYHELFVQLGRTF
ncbi:MAG: hypothetical protein IT369_13380 [Candidatus Latescibacteria bacterium]|nr:hypothetical protein [Candidatus Latescibacterota bacterium]